MVKTPALCVPDSRSHTISPARWRDYVTRGRQEVNLVLFLLEAFEQRVPPAPDADAAFPDP